MRPLAILIVLSVLPLKSELLPIRNYTTADGLAADGVGCIVPDSRGFLWFCTAEGLSRFDGYHFVNYGLNEGLPHQVISAFLETRFGDHWIGTARGVCRISSDSKGAPCTTYRLGQEARQNFVTALLESRSGRIWCATAAGLFEWVATGSFRRKEFPTPGEILITYLAESTEGDLWIGTTAGIYILRGNDVVQTLTLKDGLPGEWVEEMLLDSHGRMWAALRGGLALITRAGNWSLKKAYREASGLVNGDVKALHEAADGTLWVGTAFGISCLKLNTSDPSVLQNLTRAQGLSDRQINAIAEDPAGNIWAGTEAAGVMRIARFGFTTYRESHGLDTDRAMSVFEDRAGELLAVTVSGGGGRRSVDIFDGAQFRSVVPKAFGDQASWGWHQVLLQSRTGEWWAATKQGLCRFGRMSAADLDGQNPSACYSRDSEVFRDLRIPGALSGPRRSQKRETG